MEIPRFGHPLYLGALPCRGSSRGLLKRSSLTVTLSAINRHELLTWRSETRSRLMSISWLSVLDVDCVMCPNNRYVNVLSHIAASVSEPKIDLLVSHVKYSSIPYYSL